MHKNTKIKIAIFVLLVGMACMFTAVVTDHWAVLSPQVHKVNETCEAAHFGLWRLCKKHIYIHSETFREGQSCGPISLPGGESGLRCCARGLVLVLHGWMLFICHSEQPAEIRRTGTMRYDVSKNRRT